jgi:hypothetical protein
MSGEPDPPIDLDVHQNGGSRPTASLDAITTLIHSFALMIQGVEQRITERISANADASKDRWERWETDFRDYRKGIEKRLTLLEASVHDHAEEARQAKIAREAKIRPIRALGLFLVLHWRDILILLIGILALMGFTEATLERFVK